MYYKMLSKQIPFIPLVVAFIFQVSWVYAADPQKDFLQGTRYLRQNEIDSAINSFDLALKALLDITDRNEEQNKLMTETLNNRGLAYMEKAKAESQQDPYLDLAEKDFKNAQDILPDDERAGYNLGLLYYEQGRYEDSIAAYEAGLALIPPGAPFQPYHVDVFSNLGACYTQNDPPDTAKALESYTQAIEIAKANPNRDRTMIFSMTYYNRGNLYYNLNQYDKAGADYTETINFFEKFGDTRSEILKNAYYNRGLCYYNQGKYQKAIDDYNRVIELNPDFLWAYYAKGFAHYIQGQDKLAEEAYQHVIAPDETNLSTDERAHVKFGYGLIYVRKKMAGQNNFDKGMLYLKEACNSGRCEIACQTIEKGVNSNPGTILVFELPK